MMTAIKCNNKRRKKKICATKIVKQTSINVLGIRESLRPSFVFLSLQTKNKKYEEIDGMQ